MKQGLVRLLYNLGKVHGVDITHDNVCSSMLSCFYSHLLSTGRPISSYYYYCCYYYYYQCSECNSFKLFLQQISFVSVTIAVITKILSHRVEGFALSRYILFYGCCLISNFVKWMFKFIKYSSYFI